ncbi:DNA methylase [Escherichia coli]|nr:DNA methylase [Escherichia coli]
MLNTVKISSCKLINADCLEFIQTLPENSVDLIVTDPPYFKVKPEGWDNQWKGDDDYLKWLDQCLAQFWRVLKPAGSLYLFCGHRLASDIEIMMRERFSVLNHIIWAKPSGRWNGCNKESLRAYFPATERILFAEHYQGPYRPKDAGYAAKGSALKQHVMAPLISYFRDARGSGRLSVRLLQTPSAVKAFLFVVNGRLVGVRGTHQPSAHALGSQANLRPTALRKSRMSLSETGLMIHA